MIHRLALAHVASAAVCLLALVTWGVSPAIAAVRAAGAPLERSTTVAGEEPGGGCAEPDYIALAMWTVGTPFDYHESFGCLPSGDEFSRPVIHWGDGTSSAGQLGAAPSAPAGLYVRVPVSGEHTYTQPGSYQISAEVTDERSGRVYTGGWHTAVDAQANPRPMPGETPPPSSAPPPPDPTQRLEIPSPVVRLLARTLAARSGVLTRTESVAHGTSSLPASKLVARISWGDGSTARGVVAGGTNGAFDVRARHRWRHAGRYAIVVTVSARGGDTLLARTVSYASVRARR